MTVFTQTSGWASLLDRPRLARTASIATVALLVAIIAAYAGLIPLGQWQADEYDNFRGIRDNGIMHVMMRITTWSPRPISEFLIYLYGTTVNALGSPLIAPVLSALWLVLVAACILPACSRPETGPGRSFILVLPIALIALFMSGPRVSELFYWPQGALAYLPTLSAIAFVVLATAFGKTRGPGWRIGIVAALLCAALSSEVGAFFVALYCLGMIALFVVCAVVPTWRPFRADRLVDYMLPLLAALWVIRALFLGRVSVPPEVEGLIGDPRIARDVTASLLFALRDFPLELASLGSGQIRIRYVLLGLLYKGAFAVGCYCVLVRLPLTRDLATTQRLAMLAAAALAAAFLSLFGGYYTFGTMCCERHETMRECFALLAILAAVALVVRLAPARLPKPAGNAVALLAALSFTISVLVANTYGFSRLATEYSNYGLIIEADRQTWESGRAPARTMVFSLAPMAVVGQAGTWPPGTFMRRDPTTNFRISLVLDFFGKDEISFVDRREPPAQASQPR